MLPTDSQERKNTPIFSGVLMYFPLAIAYVARVSMIGSNKHHPGKGLFWDRTKSKDHADCAVRHLMEHDKEDEDGILHAGYAAWRSLALLQELLEKRAKRRKKK